MINWKGTTCRAALYAFYRVLHRKLASNIVNGIEETFQREKAEHKQNLTGQMSLFGSEVTEKQIFDDKVQKLKEAILRLPKNNPLSREELHYEIINQDKSWFGKIGRKHLTQALKALLNETSPGINCIGTPGNDDSIFTILE